MAVQAPQNWRQEPYPAARFKPFAHIRGMINGWEQLLLHNLAQDAGTHGCIIDAGAFLGRSTAILADGIRHNPNPLKKVHSFDLFRARNPVAEMFGLQPDQNIFPIYAANIAPWAHRIVVHPGDILTSNWRPEPIDILFLDVLKTPEIGDWASRAFFRQLVPGSIVIQQDFVHEWLPWIHVAMGFYADHFRLLTTAAPSVAFVCEHPIDTGFCYSRLARREKRRLFDRACEPFTDRADVDLLEKARATI